MIPAEYGPGYDALSQQSYPNLFAPYYGQKVPFVNQAPGEYPNANGDVQAPDMIIY